MMLASVSKTITAVAVLKLWEECRGTDRAFALDDPFWPHIKKFCPQADDGVKRVTIRQLLTHKSGFNKDIDNYLTSPKDLEKLLTQPLAAKPGTVYQYNNDNYYILRLIIEAIGRQHYTPYVREHVLGPMAVTGLTTNPAAKPLALAYGAAADRGPGSWFGGDYDSRAGAVGWFGSAVDLGRFLEGIRTHKVLEPGTTKIMFDEDMGWDSSQPGWTKGGDWNDGRGDWVHTVIAIFPDGVVAAILTNSQMPPGVNASLLGDAWMRGRGR
jgi:CubicO group peptidase (beta-lactamase class C family)